MPTTNGDGYTPMTVSYDDNENSPRDGRFELTGEISDSVPRQNSESGPEKGGSGDLTRKMSQIDEMNKELDQIMEQAETQNPEYAAIVKGATEVEDVASDVWGALIFVVVHDLPDFRAGRMMLEGRVRMFYTLLVFAMNFFIQATLLYFIIKLLTMPSLLGAQDIYKEFRKTAFVDSEHTADISVMSADSQAELCGLALSQMLFVRIILFLWVTNNVMELRDTLQKMVGAISLPILPEGLDTRLMKRNLDTSQRDDNIICLNLKGKVGLITLVFMPKMIIATVLMFTGCVWLMAAANIGDLILNSLALAFVVKVDELLAEVFFPRNFLEMVSDLAFVLPARGASDKDDAMQERAWEFIMCAITMAFTFIFVEVMIFFQPVIPEYAYDVHAACMDYLSQQVPWCLPFQADCFPESGK